MAPGGVEDCARTEAQVGAGGSAAGGSSWVVTAGSGERLSPRWMLNCTTCGRIGGSRAWYCGCTTSRSSRPPQCSHRAGNGASSTLSTCSGMRRQPLAALRSCLAPLGLRVGLGRSLVARGFPARACGSALRAHGREKSSSFLWQGSDGRIGRAAARLPRETDNAQDGHHGDAPSAKTTLHVVAPFESRSRERSRTGAVGHANARRAKRA